MRHCGRRGKRQWARKLAISHKVMTNQHTRQELHVCYDPRSDCENVCGGKEPTYARIVVDFRPQKDDPNRVRITAGGNLIKKPGDLTTRTADLTTSKIVWNSVISTEGAAYTCLDVGNFYLETPLETYEYMKMPLDIFPSWTRKQYNLDKHAYKGFVYWKICRAICGLPNAGRLANEQLKKHLKPDGYYEVAHTPGLWRHRRRPIQFSLIVDDFGVKHVGKEHAEHLI